MISAAGHFSLRCTGANTQIIIVDNNADRRFEMLRYFESFDMKAISVSGVLELYRRLARPGCCLVILELELAKEHGFGLLRKIRCDFHVPVILTGDRPDDTEGIIGLESGADDYVSMPLSLRELVARARAILRRKQRNDDRSMSHGIKRRGYAFNGWTLDLRSRILRDETGDPLPLTKGEFALLIAFLDRPRQILTRMDLKQAIHVDSDTTDRSVDVAVARLRGKLQSRPSAPGTIETVRALGYNFNTVVKPY